MKIPLNFSHNAYVSTTNKIQNMSCKYDIINSSFEDKSSFLQRNGNLIVDTQRCIEFSTMQHPIHSRN